ncbi:MAG: DUF192 domain-containing protein [Patescibacteria group bacterium]
MLKNLNTNISIDTEIIHLKTLFDKTFGAIKYKDKGILLKTRFGLHSFFVKDTLEVIVLDKNLKVVKINENFSPNKVFFWNLQYSLILELQRGSVNKLKLKVGHIVKFNL